MDGLSAKSCKYNVVLDEDRVLNYVTSQETTGSVIIDRIEGIMCVMCLEESCYLLLRAVESHTL